MVVKIMEGHGIDWGMVFAHDTGGPNQWLCCFWGLGVPGYHHVQLPKALITSAFQLKPPLCGLGGVEVLKVLTTQQTGKKPLFDLGS